MNKIEHGNDLQEILTQALEQMKMDQGDKFDLSNVNLAELSRRTGITRAKKKVIIVGQKRALFTAIHRNDNVRRNTALAERICSEYEKLNIKKSRKPVKRKEEAVQLTL